MSRQTLPKCPFLIFSREAMEVLAEKLFAGEHPELAPVVFDWFVAHYEAYKKKLPEVWMATPRKS